MSPRRHLRCIALALGTAIVLAATTGIASSRTLSSNSQTFRATFAVLEFFGEGIGFIDCPTTLEGSFHSRTITKTARMLIGAITEARIKQNSCTNGTVSTFDGAESYNGTTPPNTLPWHVTYESFTGSLPSIEAVNMLVSRFRLGISTSAGVCIGQYGGSSDNVTYAATLGAGGAITSLRYIAGRNDIRLIRRDGGLVCPNVRIGGSASVTQLNSSASVRITLI